jgi:hypothetical protein
MAITAAGTTAATAITASPIRAVPAEADRTKIAAYPPRIRRANIAMRM